MSVKSVGVPTAIAATSGTVAGVTFSTTALNSNIRTVTQQGGVPLVAPASFTMGNNGAITLGTANTRTFLNCYVYMLAGDVAAGVPASAGWYFAQFSSTTVGTVFNNNWNGTGVPPLVTSPTAFSTTGPGARTGDTGAETAFTITIPALTLNSQILLTLPTNVNNTAGTKTYTIALGGTTFHMVTATSVARASGVFRISNTGATNKQLSSYEFLTGYTVSTQEASGTIDTSAATSLTVVIQRGTATDSLNMMPPIVEVIY